MQAHYGSNMVTCSTVTAAILGPKEHLSVSYYVVSHRFFWLLFGYSPGNYLSLWGEVDVFETATVFLMLNVAIPFC